MANTKSCSTTYIQTQQIFVLFRFFFVWYCIERTDKELADVICIQGDTGTCLLAFMLKGVTTSINVSHPSDSDAKTDKAHAHMYIKDRICFAVVSWEAAALMY